MARPLRLDLPGVRHHVMNRGARQEHIFLQDADRVAFLGLLAELPVRFGVEVHAWALMPDHFHLLLVCPRGGLGVAMQYLQSRFARHLNRRYVWNGPVFRARYKNRVVEDDAWWAHLFAYVHLNPARAGLVKGPHADAWTSHRYYLGQASRPDWLSADAIGEVFATAEDYRAYVEDVHLGRTHGPEGFDPTQLWTTPATGQAPPPEPPPSRWPYSPQAAWLAVQSITGRSRAQLMHAPTGRGGGNPDRELALWWLPRALGEQQADFARRLKLSPTVVSRAGRRVRERARTDARFAEKVDRLERLLPR